MRSAPDADAAVGMEMFVTPGEPCQGRAKSTPEDFVVEEYMSLPTVSESDGEGLFPLYRVEKKGIDTMHMERELADALKSKVSFGGMKDSRAVATQYVTPTSRRSERPELVERGRFTATRVGFVGEPISRANIVGNRFDVVLRGCCGDVGDRVAWAFRLGAEGRLPNFYGLQRFGARGAPTHLIGKAIVSGDFKGAVGMMLWTPQRGDSEHVKEAKEAMLQGRVAEGASALPPGMDTERMVAGRLARKPDDWTGALRAVPIRLRRLYVQAYQSFLFNRTLSRFLGEGGDISAAVPGDNWCELQDGIVPGRVAGVKEGPKPGSAPMVQMAGYAFRNYGSRLDACAVRVMEEEGVGPRDFYVNEMQEVSAEGGFRLARMTVKNAECEASGGTARLRFALGKGQFATVLLREVLKPDDPESSGLA